MSEGKEAVKEVNQFLNKKCPTCGRSKADLVITDVPIETLKQFKEFGNSEEFKCTKSRAGHWGFALKFLIDFYTGRIQDGLDEVDAKAEEALTQLSQLKAEPEQPQAITLVNGRKIPKIGG